MKKTISKIIFSISMLASMFALSSHSYASVTPSLSVSPQGDGDSVSLTVNGDPSQSVIFYYLKTGYGQQVASLGNTNVNGTFSTILSSSSYGIVSNSPVHITIGGVSGLSSSVVNWPTVTTSLTNQITLSQTGVVLSVGGSSTINVTNNSSALYVSNNSNAAVANINISGNSITVTGNSQGSTIVSICTVGNSTNCPSLYVTVQNTGASMLSFGQNNIVLSSGQNFPVSVVGGNGLYTILNNSNGSLVQASISGTTITLSTSGTSGSASLTVCTTDMISCGILNVTVGTSSNAYVTFGQTNPTVSINQSLGINIYGGTNGSYYISSNSNPSIVQASISASTLTVYGLVSGSSTLNICAASGGCGQITISVNYVATGGSITLSQTNLSLLANQTLSITIAGGTAPYSLPVSNSAKFRASISGNILSVVGVSAGTDQVAVCSMSGGCTWLYLTVNGNGATTYVPPTTTTSNGGASSSFLTMSQSNPNISVGQSTAVTVSGGIGSGYSVAYNTNSSVVSATLGSNTLLLSGVRSGDAIVVVCDTSGDCGAVFVGVGTSNNTTTTTGSTSNTVIYKFTQSLSLGSKGTEVSQLQKRLTIEGVYAGPITGVFGPLTETAVKRYQSIKGLVVSGMVGSVTRNMLNR